MHYADGDKVLKWDLIKVNSTLLPSSAKHFYSGISIYFSLLNLGVGDGGRVGNVGGGGNYERKELLPRRVESFLEDLCFPGKQTGGHKNFLRLKTWWKSVVVY